MAVMQTVMFLVAAVLCLSGLAQCFQPSFTDGTSVTHRDITEKAVLIKTAFVCRVLIVAGRGDDSLRFVNTLTVTTVQRICSKTSSSPISSDEFQIALNEIYSSNAKVDFSLLFVVERHFDSEAFQGGRDIITTGMSAVKANVKQGNFIAARQTLGEICHTLQDFYSHSDWVELGKTAPYTALIRADQPLENLAGKDIPTCKSCTGGTCTDNILPEVLSRGLLTSGYFNTMSSEKPAGKCSHGGVDDKSSKKDPVGGINKDTPASDHGSLHDQAANLAVDATLDLLEDIRIAVGDRTFLRLMGLSQSSALCFVIDTTGSMHDDIAGAKEVSFNIIDSRRGTPQEPSEYILVPFNDPDFGPVIRTTDADDFKNSINNLTANGGGDGPELCMSGLRLALTAAPPSSDIFVFTDAPAKDFNLKSTVTALIETTKSVVTFLLTDAFSGRRRRSTTDTQSSVSRALSLSDAQLYRDIAQASGGQAIEVSKSDLTRATAIIEDSSASAVVTVFQVVMDPGRPDNFTFTTDAAIGNMIVYITGASSLTFTLTSSTGVTQSSSVATGPVANFTTAGNLRRILLNAENQTGSWTVNVNSNNPYTVKVTGQSSLNFVYSLVEKQDGAHGGVSPKEGRPTSGGNVTVLVTVTGSDTATVTEVTLFDSSGPTEIIGAVKSLGSNNFLVGFTGVPSGDFVVRLRGQDSTSRSTLSSFQRQASTQIKTSTLSVTAKANITNIEPGSTVFIPFTVLSDIPGTYTVQGSNDRAFPLNSPPTVTITAGDGGKTNGTVSLTAPASTQSGTDVTLTIEVLNAAATDINYAVLRFSVAAKVTDVSGPVCQAVNTSGICPASSLLCASTQWEFIANLTDGINGTGIASITLQQGNGTLNTSTVVGAGGESITLVTYSSSCCSQTMQVAAVDRVGNVGTCEAQARALTTPPPPTTTPVMAPTNATVMAMTNATVMAPTNATVMAPTNATVMAPTNATVMAMTNATVMVPTNATVMATTNATVMAPTNATVMAMTNATVMVPTNATVMATTNATAMVITTSSALMTTSTGGHSLSTAHCLWVGVVFSLLLK